MQADLALRAEARSDGIVTIHLSGVLDSHTLDMFESGLAKALDREGTKSFLLDCEELRYVNSSGFGELIRYSDHLRERGGVLVMARVPPKVAIILEMLGLKSLIPIATSLDEGVAIAARGAIPEEEVDTDTEPDLPPADGPAHRRLLAIEPDEHTVVCAFCDARLRLAAPRETARWACPSCGAPFSATPEGGVAFEWSNAEAEAMHLTIDVTPRTLAALAGLIEGVLIERRVSHARMRRFAREAAHVCHVVSESAFGEKRRGPLHVLVTAGPQRLQIRIVDRGRPLGDDAQRIFSTQTRLFLDFRYATLTEGVNVTEFAFAYAGSGVFVA